MAMTSIPETVHRYYTPGQVAVWAGVTSMTIIRWCDAGVLHAITTPGGHRRITEHSVRDYLSKRGLPIPPEMAPKLAVDRRVVLVADARSHRAVLARFLGLAPIEPYADDYRALVAIASSTPAAVMVEASVEIDAERIVRALREGPKTSALPTIVWGEASRVEAARNAGATHAFGRDGLADAERVIRFLLRSEVRAGTFRPGEGKVA